MTPLLALAGAAPGALLAVGWDNRGDGGSGVDAGFAGFAVVVLLLLAGALLMRSMGRRLRNVPRSFDPPAPPRPPASRPGEPPAEAAPGDGPAPQGREGGQPGR